MKNEFLTKKQLAARLNRSVRTIQYWMKRGIIPFYKIEGTVLFDPEKVSRALEKFERKSRYSR
jgi:excisionase family DNA binding protein